MINVLIVEPNKLPYLKTIENNFGTREEIVGGYSKITDVLGDRSVSIIYNEAGMDIGLEPNRSIGYDVIFGNFIIVGNGKNLEFISLTDSQINVYKNKFDEKSIKKLGVELKKFKGRYKTMMNNYFGVGRIASEPEIKETENGGKHMILKLAITRSYKNEDGVYDTDFINCTLWNGIAEGIKEYCKKGDLIGVRGRIETDTYEKDGETKYATNIIGERIFFLSANKDIDKEKLKENINVNKVIPITKKAKSNSKERE